MTHWATDLIGLPWSQDGQGPGDFSCWGLVRHVFRARYGIDMPLVRVGDFTEGENVAAIKQAASRSGWRRVDGDPADGDIVLMDGLKGRHVGVMIAVGDALRLLHSDGYMTPQGPTGGVVAQRLTDATAGGYSDLELWRQAS